MRWTPEALAEHQARLKRFSQKTHINEPEQADEGLEREIDAKIAKFIKEHGYYGFHDRSRRVNVAGYLDWVIALPNGRTVYIENKSKNGKLTKEQKTNITKLLGLGHEVYECRSYKKFLEIILGK